MLTNMNNRSTVIRHWVLAPLALLTTLNSFAQRSESVKVPSGKLVVVRGAVTGNTYYDYKIQLGAGQSLAVTLQAKNRSVNFNVLPPKSSGEAMFIGSMTGSKMPPRMVPIEGTYLVRIYQMGAAADENKTNNYSITLSVKGNSLKPLSSSVDAKLKGTPFHAKGSVACTSELDPKRTSCDAYVIRRGNGSATVELRAGKSIRRVLFVKGVPKASDSSELLKFSKTGDITTVQFGDQTSESYQIPDGLVFGG